MVKFGDLNHIIKVSLKEKVISSTVKRWRDLNKPKTKLVFNNNKSAVSKNFLNNKKSIEKHLSDTHETQEKRNRLCRHLKRPHKNPTNVRPLTKVLERERNATRDPPRK